MLLMVNAPLPVFLIVKVCGALVVPWDWLPKASAVGDKLPTGPLAIPIPSRTTTWGLPVAALSEMLAKALSTPVIEGLNVKLIVQLAPTARVAGEVGQLLV